MKIISANIYGFGQLENVKIEHFENFQVFFGGNEAGKSTLSAFLTCILFGFPAKQQAELRYEPKHSAKYGGNLKIWHEKYGYCVIERIKGKAAGDVTVVLNDGTTGGEELLGKLLDHFDKSIFQAIFSFNLHGLQNIHQMKGEELGKFLFSAGMLGTERLSKTEAVLQKELDSRFKPGGKKPFLNEKLHELHGISQELKKAAAKNNEYEALLTAKQTLQVEIGEINGRIAELQAKVDKLQEWKRIEPLVKEEMWTRKELEAQGEINFPVRGIERLENVKQLILPLNAEIASLTERIGMAKQDLASHQPNEALLGEEAAILSILDQASIYEQLKNDAQQCELKLADTEEELSILKEKLHLPLEEEDALSINTNFFMKNQVEQQTRNNNRLEEAKQELEKQYQEEKLRLEAIEKEVRLTESLCLSKQERTRLEDMLHGNDKKSLEEQLGRIKDKITFYQESIVQNRASSTRFRLQLIIFAFVLAGFAVYGVLTEQWILLGLGLIGGLLLAVFFFLNGKNQKDHQYTRKLEQLQNQEKQLTDELRSAEYQDVEKLASQLKQDDRNKEQLHLLNIKLNHQQSQFERIIVKFEEWEAESAKNKAKLNSLSRELKIPDYLASSFLLEAFQLIEQFKANYREKQQWTSKLQQIRDQQKKLDRQFSIYEQRFLSQRSGDIPKITYLLRKKLKEEQEKMITRRERQSKLSELETELAQKTTERDHLQKEFNRWIRNAGAETEQQFYELGKKADKILELKDRLAAIEGQLHFSILSRQERIENLQIHQVEDMMDEISTEAERLNQVLKTQHEKQASVNYEIQILEEGGIYSDILHRYKQKKFELEEAAKEWAVYSLAQDILFRTIDKYQNEHLPRMLAKAEELLTFLTDGSYQRIYLHPAGTGFRVERRDQTVFEANELSQATAEQLYVSIRLALALTIYEKYQLPIIIDDSFVNFDSKRTGKVLHLLRQLGQNQILFFTCHDHLLSHFSKENVVRLDAVKVS
ncbi:AAA family ATPase [Neobacillus muris]|uniref:AAA family ATPase n=1 Tax=Neobacillus muris TaxID=2941334 RepID=UPI00203AC9B7|nr:AAA family ATPase [Neobacillus muris]